MKKGAHRAEEVGKGQFGGAGDPQGGLCGRAGNFLVCLNGLLHIKYCSGCCCFEITLKCEGCLSIIFHEIYLLAYFPQKLPVCLLMRLGTLLNPVPLNSTFNLFHLFSN